MQVDDAAALLLDLLQTLAEKGIVTEGQLTIIRPVRPGLIRPVAYVQDYPVKTIRAVVEKVNGRPQELPTLEPTKENARGLGYTGNICLCGSCRMVRRGTCEYCESCGASNGCS